jgi:hypothetical protein
MQMTGRNIALVLVVALAGGFLVGFVPGCMRTSDLQSRLDRAEQATTFSTARDLACMLHVEIANRNYGNAADLSARFFDHVRALSENTNDGATRDQLQQILAEREPVSSGLAKNDPGIEPQVRGMIQRLHSIGPAPLPAR